MNCRPLNNWNKTPPATLPFNLILPRTEPFRRLSFLPFSVYFTLYHSVTNFDANEGNNFWKTLWEKEKMLVKIFCLFSAMFSTLWERYTLWFFLRFNPMPNKHLFLRVSRRGLLKTLWEKEKLLVTSNFSFSHSVFPSFRRIFYQTLNCCLLTISVWKSQ